MNGIPNTTIYMLSSLTDEEVKSGLSSATKEAIQVRDNEVSPKRWKAAKNSIASG